MYLFETIKNFKTDKLIISTFILFLLVSASSLLAAPPDTVTVNARNGEANGKSIYEILFSVSKPIPF